jgi:hypothetical protein
MVDHKVDWRGHMGDSPRFSNVVKKEQERTWPQFDGLLINVLFYVLNHRLAFLMNDIGVDS